MNELNQDWEKEFNKKFDVAEDWGHETWGFEGNNIPSVLEIKKFISNFRRETILEFGDIFKEELIKQMNK